MNDPPTSVQPSEEQLEQTIKALVGEGRACELSENTDGAQRSYETALSLAERSFGATSLTAATVLIQLAALHAQADKPYSAAEYWHRVMAILRT